MTTTTTELVSLSQAGVSLIMLEQEAENNFRELRRRERELREAQEKLVAAKKRWNDTLVKIARVKNTKSPAEAYVPYKTHHS